MAGCSIGLDDEGLGRRAAADWPAGAFACDVGGNGAFNFVVLSCTILSLCLSLRRPQHAC